MEGGDKIDREQNCYEVSHLMTSREADEEADHHPTRPDRVDSFPFSEASAASWRAVSAGRSNPAWILERSCEYVQTRISEGVFKYKLHSIDEQNIHSTAFVVRRWGDCKET